MADTMTQPTPGLEVTGPDDTMELSSELGIQAPDDIDVDIDLTGSGMKSPAQHDDYMTEDYKNEIDMDAMPLNNDMNLDDDIMVDDAKVQDDLVVVDRVIPDEELRDISDIGQDDFGSESNEASLHQGRPEQDNTIQGNTTEEYSATVIGFEQSADHNIDEPQPDEDLIDYSDEEDDSIAEQGHSVADRQDKSVEINADEATAALTTDLNEESLAPKETGVSGEDSTTLEIHQHSTEIVSSTDRNGARGKQASVEDSYRDVRSSPSRRQSSGSVIDGHLYPDQKSNSSPGHVDDAANRENGLREEYHALEAGKDRTGESMQPDATTDGNFETSNLNSTTDPTDVDNPGELGEHRDEDAPNDAGHAENQFVGKDDDHHFEPLPISTIVTYEGNEYSLFASGVEGDNTTFFLSDESLANGSIHDLLKECRTVLGESVSDECELEIGMPDLGLSMNESCVYAITTSLRQVIDAYVKLMKLDGAHDLEPLYVNLTATTSFASRLANLIQAANAGKGLSQLDFLQIPELYNENSTQHETGDAEQGNSYPGEMQSHDWAQNEFSQDLHTQEEAKEYAQEHELSNSRNSEAEDEASQSRIAPAGGHNPDNSVLDPQHKAEGQLEATSHNNSTPEHVPDLSLGQSTDGASSHVVTGPGDSGALEAEASETHQADADTGLDAFDDLLDDGEDAAEPLNTDHGPDQPPNSQLLGQSQFRDESEEGLEGNTGSGNVITEDQVTAESTGDQAGRNGDFDFDGIDEYPEATDINGLNMGNEDAEDLFLFDEDTTAVDSGDHGVDAIRSFDHAHEDKSSLPTTDGMGDIQSGYHVHSEQKPTDVQEDANDDIFDEIDFNDEDELPEFQNDQVPKPKTQVASPKLQAKRSWDEHNADSSRDGDEHDPKRVRS